MPYPAAVIDILLSLYYFYMMAGRTFISFSDNRVGDGFASRALSWGSCHFDTAAYLNSNQYTHDHYSRQDEVIALGAADAVSVDGPGAFEQLKAFSDSHKDWLFGFFSYELKNQLEELQSKNPEAVGMPLLYFFRPEILFVRSGNTWRLGCLPGSRLKNDPAKVLAAIRKFNPLPGEATVKTPVKARVSREKYLEQVSNIKRHIQAGDIYEMNYCVEFFSDKAHIDPLLVYERLNQASPAPFSCFFKVNGRYLLSSSPERFMAKRGDRLISQPIKGTSARSADEERDKALKEALFYDSKERSENVMIVDLVRNDLSRTAMAGSVQVEELFGLYSFRHVHQMISTVVSRLHPGFHYLDAIRYAFPMGSMTGAPKIRAMQLIDHYEEMSRGLYSGAVGYISPEKDFDFNVVIRSILYNGLTGYLSFIAGSAITIGSVPEKEYEECLLKAGAMAKAVGSERILEKH
ncbi:MAG: anthranilate synthase component I family protein [Bacteroidales bacterium]|nr:anthranilate synthase component I family protein [Bacteroidales bacterium]